MILLRSDITFTIGARCSLTAKWVRDLQLSCQPQSDFEMEMLDLPSAAHYKTSSAPFPLFYFTLIAVHAVHTTVSSLLFQSVLYFSVICLPHFLKILHVFKIFSSLSSLRLYLFCSLHFLFHFLSHAPSPLACV